jgi:hypothetical protein
VPADEGEGAGGDVHYVTVEQDPDQSPEVCVSALTDEGKPRFIHQPLCFFKTSEFTSCYCMCIYVQELK